MAGQVDALFARTDRRLDAIDAVRVQLEAMAEAWRRDALAGLPLAAGVAKREEIAAAKAAVWQALEAYWKANEDTSDDEWTAAVAADVARLEAN